MDRYRVAPTRDARAFGILDREVYDYCGLPDEDGRPRELTWESRALAEAWLNRCYRTWQTWEGNGAGTPPKNWRPHPPGLSPWDPGSAFYE